VRFTALENQQKAHESQEKQRARPPSPSRLPGPWARAQGLESPIDRPGLEVSRSSQGHARRTVSPQRLPTWTYLIGFVHSDEGLTYAYWD
jgi:hypothetical protein